MNNWEALGMLAVIISLSLLAVFAIFLLSIACYRITWWLLDRPERGKR